MTWSRRRVSVNSAARIQFPTIAARARTGPVFSPAARHKLRGPEPRRAESREGSRLTRALFARADLAGRATARQRAPADQPFPGSAAACRLARVLPMRPVRFDERAIGA